MTPPTPPTPPPLPTPPEAGAGRRPGDTADIRRLQASLLKEAQRLRLLFDEVLSNYKFRVESRIGHVTSFLQQTRLADAFFKKTPEQIRQDLRFMMAQFKSLKLKPNKGRRKDLKRIETLVEALLWVQELDKPIMSPRVESPSGKPRRRAKAPKSP
jgi:hypothetical protein